MIPNFANWMRALLLGAAMAAPAHAATAGQDELIGEVLAFYGTQTIVETMSTHCYESAGLEEEYEIAAQDWYLRNVSFLDLAHRVLTQLDGLDEERRRAAEIYSGTQIMTAFNAAPDKRAFCLAFRESLEEGVLDIDRQFADTLERARAVTIQ
ncbi:hypothetical protein EMQ25_14385 [Arsenicitalea aurantiaca]|uniref:Uncharacterized protein n=1 Tax=Arsenicitalea aurantiaca TaxID=1783274 RepID=A0A433X5I4_9HYPH|nr:hypothetical protein [Arsenicitalea aurantiaca]RUT29308.1 hypothetical protein EMQ25_14385 [Arsenicitalea aurantiaca]